MRRITARVHLATLAVSLLGWIVLGSCGSNTSTTTPPTTTGDPVAVTTAAGTPNGSAATAVIGPTGGSLPSTDGRLTVIIPPGAVTTNTSFSIQPISNLAPGGVGAGYRLGPSGQSFTIPVQVTMHLTDSELLGAVPDALGMAYQDAQGYWNEPLAQTFDGSGNTLIVSTTHFSDWVAIDGLQLSPAHAEIPVSTSVGLTITYCIRVPPNGVAAQRAKCYTQDIPTVIWAVNSAPGGTSTLGTVVGGSSTATYSAPANQPSPSTVAVSAKINNFLSRSGTLGTVQAVANITVYEESWTGESSVTEIGVGKSVGQIKWVLEKRVGNVATYRPSGIVTASYDQCTISPTTHDLLPATDGLLVVDYNPIPATYHGIGTSAWTAAFTCGGAHTFGQVAAFYFGALSGGEASGVVTVVSGQSTIAGNALGTNWNFTRDH